MIAQIRNVFCSIFADPRIQNGFEFMTAESDIASAKNFIMIHNVSMRWCRKIPN
jgi:hypothetical protein